MHHRLAIPRCPSFSPLFVARSRLHRGDRRGDMASRSCKLRSGLGVDVLYTACSLVEKILPAALRCLYPLAISLLLVFIYVVIASQSIYTLSALYESPYSYLMCHAILNYPRFIRMFYRRARQRQAVEDRPNRGSLFVARCSLGPREGPTDFPYD